MSFVVALPISVLNIVSHKPMDVTAERKTPCTDIETERERERERVKEKKRECSMLHSELCAFIVTPDGHGVVG